MDSNFKEILGLNGDETNCTDWQPFVGYRYDQIEIPIGIDIDFSSELNGTIDLSLLPCTIQPIAIKDALLNGTLDFLHLPRDLLTLNLQNTHFSADFSHMKRNQ